MDERGKGHPEPNIPIKTQLLAHAKQPLLGPHLRVGIIIVFWITNCTKQHRITLHAKFMSVSGIRVARFINGAGTDRFFVR